MSAELINNRIQSTLGLSNGLSPETKKFKDYLRFYCTSTSKLKKYRMLQIDIDNKLMSTTEELKKRAGSQQDNM